LPGRTDIGPFAAEQPDGRRHLMTFPVLAAANATHSHWYDGMVPIAPEALLEQALSLSSADRAKLASGLLASLDDDQADEAEVERLWSEETDRRMALLDSGDVDLIEWEHVTERIDGLRASSTAE
jgi:hypothetical protein